MITTAGHLMIDEALPEDMRKGHYDLDKKGITKLMAEIAERYPEKYREIAQKLMVFGHYAAESSGTSISLSSLRKPPEIKALIDTINQQLKEVVNNNKLNDKQKEEFILKTVNSNVDAIKNGIFKHGLANNSPFAQQAASGSRGNTNQLMQLIAGDGLVADHRDRPIGIPILHGYAEGLDPVEYFAGSYGSRKGSASTKFATAEAGFFGKQLAQAAHRLVVTTHDCGTQAGIPVPADDPDNDGAVLANEQGDFKAGTAINSKVMKSLGHQQIYVRSPVTCQAHDGICAKCAGIREKGRFPRIGENVGMPAAHALSEKMSQGLLSVKHTGGQVGAGGPSKSGFKYVDQLIQVPSSFADASTVASTDGKVEHIREAPQGGKYVTIDKQEFYVPISQNPTVKIGDDVEAGDSISNGIPNPSEVVKYKGIGEGRKYFIQALYDGFKNSGITPHRRNVEALSRALINHVQITDPNGYNGFLPDDVIQFDELRKNYEPREGAFESAPDRVKNHYLEKPILHYSIGSRLTPRVMADMKANGVKKVTVHKDAPPFQPTMIRAMEGTSKDSDPLTRMYGSYLGKGFAETVHRGRSSKTHSTSFVPSLAEGVHFGENLYETGEY